MRRWLKHGGWAAGILLGIPTLLLALLLLFADTGVGRWAIRHIVWLASDVNLAPMIALKYVERFVALAHGGLRGAFITLKLNDDGVFEALPRLAARIAKLGAAHVRYTQLPSHRSEIVAILDW